MIDYREKLDQVPEYVREYMNDGDVIYTEIFAHHTIEQKDYRSIIHPIVQVFLGELKIENFLSEFKKNLPGFDEQKLKNLALEICYKRFYPVRDYVKGVEKVIVDLGGVVPTSVPLFSEEYKKQVAQEQEDERKKEIEASTLNTVDQGMTGVASQSKTTVLLRLSDALAQYPELLKQFISAKPIKVRDADYLVNPTVKNWLKDYLDALGSGRHTSYERTNYLFNSDNGKHLDHVDRGIVNAVLRSYDEGTELPIDIQIKQIIINKLMSERLEGSATGPTIKGNTINLKKN